MSYPYFKFPYPYRIQIELRIQNSRIQIFKVHHSATECKEISPNMDTRIQIENEGNAIENAEHSDAPSCLLGSAADQPPPTDGISD